MSERTPASGDDRRDSVHAFADLALIAVETQPTGQALRRVAELAKSTLSDVEDVSLTLLENGRPRSVVFTGLLAVHLDERQYEAGFGPCLDAAASGQTIVVDTDSEDSLYREFARLARRAGVRQAVSVGMPIGQRSIGGLNIYRTAETPISRQFLERAEVFAGYAAVAVSNVVSYADAVLESQQLRAAMESRATIEQAKGIIMAREHCSADQAFEVLKRVSQHQNVKLRDLAAAMVKAAGK